MAGWWLTEAIPLAATALLPLAVLPLLGVSPVKAVATPYADELIYLFLGGFILGRAFEQSGLHRRVALLTLLAMGVRPGAVVAGVMLVTALISMWVSNTATAIMMLPIGLSLIALVEHSITAHEKEGHGWDRKQLDRFARALLLGLAYAASIGGMGTPLGTPPNLQFMSNAHQLYEKEYSFLSWCKLGMPLVALMLPAAWAMLTLGLYRVRAGEIPGGRRFMRAQLRALGPMAGAEYVTLAVFLVAVVFWVGREWISRQVGLVHLDTQGSAWLPLTDAGIAIIAAVALFAVPVSLRTRRPVLHASDIDAVPWSILLLFGGGLSLAAGMKVSGVDTYLGSLFAGLGGLPRPVLLAVIAISITLLSELASNTAVAATTLPVLAAAAQGLGLHPYELMIPATFAASCGFMLPVATPPNAIVFGTGRLTVRGMAHAGIWMDVIAAGTIVVFLWLAGPALIDLP